LSSLASAQMLLTVDLSGAPFNSVQVHWWNRGTEQQGILKETPCFVMVMLHNSDTQHPSQKLLAKACWQSVQVLACMYAEPLHSCLAS
jgi:hypothetical protein